MMNVLEVDQQSFSAKHFHFNQSYYLFQRIIALAIQNVIRWSDTRVRKNGRGFTEYYVKEYNSNISACKWSK